VIEEGTYGGRPVYRVTDGTDVLVFDKATTNYIARLRDGQAVHRITPHAGSYSWPLAVGKQWTASFRSEHLDVGRSFDPVESSWRVEAYEDITVPAGTFKAFRLQSTPGRNEGEKYTVWYAPELKLGVRRILERIPAHFRGPGIFLHEVMEYRPAGSGVAAAPQPRTERAPSPSIGNAPRPERSASTPAPKQYQVTYRVKGTTEEASLTYRNAQGELVQTAILIPPGSVWAVTFDAPPGRFLYVSAQNARDAGSISCEILLDGHIKAQVSGTGAYVTVSCNDEARDR
jgi:hypothetical protein